MILVMGMMHFRGQGNGASSVKTLCKRLFLKLNSLISDIFSYWQVEPYNKIHSCPKFKLQSVLSFSSFVHNSSINEHKNMKLRESICYESLNQLNFTLLWLWQ